MNLSKFFLNWSHFDQTTKSTSIFSYNVFIFEYVLSSIEEIEVFSQNSTDIYNVKIFTSIF